MLGGDAHMQSLQTQHTFAVLKGVYYEVRYRVYNVYGWSQYSPAASFIASDVPSTPLAPTLVNVDSQQISLDFDMLTIDDGGLPITGYQL
jgi:hypothetical protein